MSLDLRIITGSNTPIYRQIVEQVRLASATGAAPPGTQLPSVRAVAEQLVINPNTVAKAYGELSREGVVDSQPGRGFFIAERRQRLSDAERERLLVKALDSFAQQILLLDFDRDTVLARIAERLDATASVVGSLDASASNAGTGDTNLGRIDGHPPNDARTHSTPTEGTSSHVG